MRDVVSWSRFSCAGMWGKYALAAAIRESHGNSESLHTWKAQFLKCNCNPESCFAANLSHRDMSRKGSQIIAYCLNSLIRNKPIFRIDACFARMFTLNFVKNHVFQTFWGFSSRFFFFWTANFKKNLKLSSCRETINRLESMGKVTQRRCIVWLLLSLSFVLLERCETGTVISIISVIYMTCFSLI